MQLANEYLNKAMRGLLDVTDQMAASIREKGDIPESKKLLDDLQRQRTNIQKQIDAPFASVERLLLWMLVSLLLTMNVGCDYIALWKTRFILRSVDKSHSNSATFLYLCLDLVLSVAIWAIAGAVFVFARPHTFLQMMSEDSVLLRASAIVSLGTTLATSVWIYAFLLGGFISGVLRRTVRQGVVRTTSLIDSYEHPFKVIGILGSTAIVSLTVAVFGVIRLWR